MQVRRDARVARGSFSGAARHVNAILLSSETESPRDIGSREGRKSRLWRSVVALARPLCHFARQKGPVG